MAFDIKVPVVLLKTRSQPDDTYEEYFSTTSLRGDTSASFEPVFVPVLEHKQDEEALGSLESLLRNNELKEKYGGMIFTSQRAVEGWADTVLKVEKESRERRGAQVGVDEKSPSNSSQMNSDLMTTNVETAIDTRTNQPFTTDISSSTTFPLYTVGPATSRALTTLVNECAANSESQFIRLRPEILGAQTGNGANLAKYMLDHYNALHNQRYFTYFEAPRLPFVPLLGMGSENYSRKRLEESDPRLQKKPLLFLVGEQRRDIIPRSLTSTTLAPEDRIHVEEIEVYSTIEKPNFKESFTTLISQIETQSQSTHQSPPLITIIIIFSPQGSQTLLQSLGYIDTQNDLTEKSKQRWPTTTSLLSNEQHTTLQASKMKYIIATIGPTTRDHLINNFNFEPDICAKTPSPEGLGDGIEKFLREKHMI